MMTDNTELQTFVIITQSPENLQQYGAKRSSAAAKRGQATKTGI
jgi:hypothetical protein